MKVGIVMPLADVRGGAEMMLLHLLRANKRTARIEYFLVFLEQGPMVQEAAALGYPVQVIPAGKLRQIVRYLSTVYALLRWMRREKLQMVMSWMSKAHLYAGPAAMLAGIEAVWYQHGIPKPDKMERCTGMIPAKTIICTSRTSKEAQLLITPKAKTAVINPAVDLAVYNPNSLPTKDELRSMLGLPGGWRLVGIMARLQRWKGIHTFVEAAASVLQANPDVHFYIVGGVHHTEPDYLDELKQMAQRTGISDNVHFAGHQAHAAQWVQAFDMLVHCSDKEPFGMVIIEGMALGKPVIAANAGGPTEIITNGENGLLTRPGDAAELAAAIQHLLDHQELSNRLSLAAVERAKAFSTERLAAEVAQLLQSPGASGYSGSRESTIEYSDL